MTHFLAGSFVAVVGLHASSAWADDLATCVTRSARPTSEIVVPVSDDPRDPQGVMIDAAETVCLAGSVDPDRRFRPHLADPTRGEPAVVELVLEHREGLTTLRIRSTLGAGLTYRAATLVGAQQLADHVASGITDPTGAATSAFREASPHRWLVHGMELRPERGWRPTLPEPPRSLARRTFEIGLEALGGVRSLSLAPFDGPLRASGYAPFPRVLPSAGAAAYAVFGRWRFTLWFQFAWGRARALRGTGGVDANFVEGRLAGGYDFLRWRGFTGFVLGGIGGGTLGIDASGPRWTYLARTAADLASPNGISRDNWELTLQTGFQQIVPLEREENALSLVF